MGNKEGLGGGVETWDGFCGFRALAQENAVTSYEVT